MNKSKTLSCAHVVLVVLCAPSLELHLGVLFTVLLKENPPREFVSFELGVFIQFSINREMFS